jgi:predicted nucleic acid-binding protein
MIVLDSDIVTLISYGQTDKLQQRLAAVPESEELAITLITRMEILRGRFDGILKAANEDELLKAMDRFRSSRRFIPVAGSERGGRSAFQADADGTPNTRR